MTTIRRLFWFLAVALLVGLLSIPTVADGKNPGQIKTTDDMLTQAVPQQFGSSPPLAGGNAMGRRHRKLLAASIAKPQRRVAEKRSEPITGVRLRLSRACCYNAHFRSAAAA
jgi:hypothetical protein